FFGGWDFAANLFKQADWVNIAYREGAPMGGKLPVKHSAKKAPTFAVWAEKDPEGANLDRLQVIKVWLDGGKAAEKIYDVALSDGRTVDHVTGKVRAVGNTVDLEKATYTNTIGAKKLAAIWSDPDFKPGNYAAYYLRVLEIPTPRWSTIAAVKRGQPP